MNADGGMRVVGYIRVSTEGQAKDGFGMDAQRKQIEDYCALHHHEILEFVVDEGKSGAKEDRPGFDRIIYGDIENPPVEAVVVAAADRIARDITVYYYYKHELRGRKIELISVKEDWGSMGAFAPVYEALLASWAQIEREAIAKRTMGGKLAKKRKGGAYIGGMLPYGYRSVEGQLVPVPEEAAVVRRMFALWRSGEGYVGIKRVLDAEGVLTRRGKEWNPSTIRGVILNERLYRGEVRINRVGEPEVWSSGTHEAILTD